MSGWRRRLYRRRGDRARLLASPEALCLQDPDAFLSIGDLLGTGTSKGNDVVVTVEYQHRPLSSLRPPLDLNEMVDFSVCILHFQRCALKLNGLGFIVRRASIRLRRATLLKRPALAGETRGGV
jgi:hypothetical protein